MSRTDKTDPYWVRLNAYGREDHDHRNGVCDLDAFDPCGAPYGWRHRTCGLRLPAGDEPSQTYWSTASVGYAANRTERAARGRLRTQLVEARKLVDRGDVDIEPVRHRHGVLWDW